MRTAPLQGGVVSRYVDSICYILASVTHDNVDHWNAFNGRNEVEFAECRTAHLICSKNLFVRHSPLRKAAPLRLSVAVRGHICLPTP